VSIYIAHRCGKTSNAQETTVDH